MHLPANDTYDGTFKLVWTLISGCAGDDSAHQVVNPAHNFDIGCRDVVDIQIAIPFQNLVINVDEHGIAGTILGGIGTYFEADTVQFRALSPLLDDNHSGRRITRLVVGDNNARGHFSLKKILGDRKSTRLNSSHV